MSQTVIVYWGVKLFFTTKYKKQKHNLASLRLLVDLHPESTSNICVSRMALLSVRSKYFSAGAEES